MTNTIDDDCNKSTLPKLDSDVAEEAYTSVIDLLQQSKMIIKKHLYGQLWHEGKADELHGLLTLMRDITEPSISDVRKNLGRVRAERAAIFAKLEE